jgi:hypothetical protein
MRADAPMPPVARGAAEVEEPDGSPPPHGYDEPLGPRRAPRGGLNYTFADRKLPRRAPRGALRRGALPFTSFCFCAF